MKRLFVLLLMLSALQAASGWAAPFTDNGNGTVTDSKTGLMWQQGEPGYMTWGSALSYCEGLSLGDYSDWRLPNIKELESLTDDTRYGPAIDTNFFPNAYASHYWSCTTNAYFPSSAWSVYFFYGFVYYNGKDGSMYVRCVRGGQSGSLGDLDHFEITDMNGLPITDKAVGEQFDIKVTARKADGTIKTGMNAKIVLNDFTRTISPLKAYLINGIASADVRINQPTLNNIITASYGNITGNSAEFQVTGNCSNPISGRVVDKNSAYLSNASVQLRLYGEQTVTDVAMSNPDGTFSFGSKTCGTYQIIATWNNYNSDLETVNNSSSVVHRTIRVNYPAVTGGKPPVILVPGFLGSTLKSKGGLTNWDAWLPRGTADREDLALHDPFQCDNLLGVGWCQIRQLLESGGYPTYAAPYDWRVSINSDASENAFERYIESVAQTFFNWSNSRNARVISSGTESYSSLR